MNTGVEVMSNIESWSWKDIMIIYRILGRQLSEYNGVHQRIGVPKPRIDFADCENIFFIRFWQDVRRINEQIKCLDKEIARRNNLMGVMG